MIESRKKKVTKYLKIALYVMIIGALGFGGNYEYNRRAGIKKEMKELRETVVTLEDDKELLRVEFNTKKDSIQRITNAKILRYETRIQNSERRERFYRKQIMDIYGAIYSRRELDSLADNAKF